MKYTVESKVLPHLIVPVRGRALGRCLAAHILVLIGPLASLSQGHPLTVSFLSITQRFRDGPNVIICDLMINTHKGKLPVAGRYITSSLK